MPAVPAGPGTGTGTGTGPGPAVPGASSALGCEGFSGSAPTLSADFGSALTPAGRGEAVRPQRAGNGQGALTGLGAPGAGRRDTVRPDRQGKRGLFTR